MQRKYHFIFMKETSKKSMSYFITGILMTMVLSGLAGCSGSGASVRSDTPPDFGSASVKRSSARPGRLTILLAQYNQSNSVFLAQTLQKRARKLLNTDDIWFSQAEPGQTGPIWLIFPAGNFQKKINNIENKKNQK